MGNTACVSNLCSKDICDDIDPKKSCSSATSASRQQQQQHQVANNEKSPSTATVVSREAEQDYPIDMDLARDRLGQWGTASGEHVIPSSTSGLDRMKTPGLNKGMAFTREERQTLGIHGLLPPRVRTQEQQVAYCLEYLETLDDGLTKFVYLMGILERNEKLFFACFATNVEACLPLVYTPAVGLACQKYGLIYRRPRGLFITIHDMGHVYDILKNWPESDVRAIVVTDGQRILGLGDLGANGMGIPIGKLALYTALAGIKPHQTLPITLDVGTNTQSLLDDPTYLGLNQKRVSGDKYDEFLDEFMKAVVKRWGANCLIQFEDFGNANAFRLIEKYRDSYCTFNDDIQGTAAVAVAGLFASQRLTKIKLSDNVIVFQGAGEASLGIANLCVMSMVAEGTSEEEARSKIWMVDSKGLIVKDRAEGGVTGHKVRYAHAHAPIRNLDEVVRTFKPTILIGAAAIGGAFTKEILEEMANNNEKPVIFALSNPTIKAECTAEEAYTHTDGRAIFASGSPFLPYTYKGRVYKTGQGNNSYIFPGIALATICVGIKNIPEEIFLTAAEALANLVKESDLEQGSLYPPLADIQKVSILVAVEICDYAYKVGVASFYPPKNVNLEAYIKAQQYDPRYLSSLPANFAYPKEKMSCKCATATKK